MNKVMLMGRLTRDPDVRYTQTAEPMAVVRFPLAVNRRFKRENEAEADFISCVAFGKTGEFINKYFHKGNMLAICGHIQTGSYEKDGKKVYTTDVIIDEAYFTGEKASGTSDNTAPYTAEPVSDDEDIPF